ncbi:MAG TPA: 50S ribosomal protein L10 [Acidimicrobiales bacterium]|nr:50S ribosomal protein L10 [Acidimicrobiales bacterium]
MDENGAGRHGSPRAEKVAVVDEVRERLSSSTAVLLTEYRGLKVSELAELRRSVRAAGGDYKIYKNTLVRFAVDELGVDGVGDLLVGPTAIAFVEGDAVNVAKALRDYSRTNPNLVLKGGLLGDRSITADEVTALAAVPPREELLARLAGGLAAPLQGFAGLLQALPRNLAYGIKALIDQGGAPGAPTDAAPAETAPADEAAAETTEVAADAVADAPENAAEAPAEAAPENAAEAPAEAAPETEAAPAAEASTESPEEA